MKWIDVLKSAPTCRIHLPDDEFSFHELAHEIKSENITGLLKWKPEWTRSSLAKLLAGLDSEWTVIVESGNKLPETNSREKGYFFISSSGTEGPSLFIAHDKKVLSGLKFLYEGKSAAALLKPGHAAGIEFFLTGLKGKNHLMMFPSAKALSEVKADILHGPPSLLAYLFSFPSQYKNFLKGLTCFYNGTEKLPSALVSKVRDSGLNFSIDQIYGTTESWRIETLTHPEKPWLIKITDPEVEIISGKIYFKKWFTGDIWKESEPGWGILEGQRHWTATLMGEKINLFDLENEIMSKKGVVDVQASALSGALGANIHLKVFASPGDHDRLRKEIRSEYQVEFFSPESMSFHKKKRTEESV